MIFNKKTINLKKAKQTNKTAGIAYKAKNQKIKNPKARKKYLKQKKK